MTRANDQTIQRGERMAKDYYLLKEYIEIMGISESTARRKIKKGELEAELVTGSPYGQEYRIPISEVERAQLITDVVKVDRPVPMDKLAEAMERALEARDKRLMDNLLEIQEWTRESTTRLDSQAGEIEGLRLEAKEALDLVAGQKEQIELLHELTRETSSRANSQTEETLVKIDNQAEEIKNLREELARLREVIEQSRKKGSWLSNLFRGRSV